MIRNLGQVAAIYIGSSAPRNTNLIWLDNTVVPFVFRAYDGSAWSEIATHKWVRAYVDGWLVTLPPRQLADDGDYMLINSNNVNYKITVKDFVKSAVGNPLDFKGVIRVSADFPNPSTLESGDMYVIITSPAGGTVTDPYSGKTFEDSEKIVWDEVTQSWESLGKIDITVDLTTSYSETEVTIHSSAGKETTIQGATDQLAGVMLPGQYSWLHALSNGSIVPGDPSPLTPLTPAHKHNYSDIVNRLVSQQGTGESTIDPMSQKATTDALNLKFDKASVLQVSGAATDKVMSQKAVTDALKTLSDDFNNKLTNYLPLVGGTMKGSIRFPAESGIIGNADGTGDTYILRSFNNRLDIGSAALSTRIISNASDLLHHRSDTSYKIWDAYNLPDPARLGVNQTFTGLNTFTKKTIIGDAVSPQILLDPANQIRYRYAAPEVSRGYTIALGDNNNIREFTFGGYYSASKNEEYAYLSLPGQAWDASTYKFYANSLKVPYKWSIDGPDGNAIIWSQTSEIVNLGRTVGTTKIRSGNTDLIHTKGSTEYIIWDKYNLSDPATKSGNNSFTGTNSFVGGKFSVDGSESGVHVTESGSLVSRSTYGNMGWVRSFVFSDNNVVVARFGVKAVTTDNVPTTDFVGILVGNGSVNDSQYKFGTNKLTVPESWSLDDPNGNALVWSQSSTLAHLGRASGTTKIRSGNTDLIHTKGSTEYIIWDKSNLPNPVRYALDASNYPTLLDSNGSSFSYIKAGPSGILPNTSVSLSSGGTGYCGTLGWSFKDGYFANVHTYKILIGPNDVFIDGQSGDSSHRGIGFYTSQNAACPVYVGSLCVSDGYANSAPNIPTNGIYSKGNIRTSGWLTFDDNEWTDTGWAYKDAKGSIKVLSVINEVNNKPTSYGSVLQFNSRQGHWCTQIWCDQTNAAGVIGTLRFRTTKSYASTEWNPWTALVTTSDLGNYLPLTGGTLSGNLTINTVGSTTFVINNNDTNGSETFMRVLRKGTASAAIGFRDSLGAYIYNYNSNKYLFIDNDGYARVGTTSSNTRLALITDIPTVSGYLPLSGGTMTGALTMDNRKNNAVIDVVGGTGNNWNGGAGALSVQIPNDNGQTPLILARRSGATINTTTLSERLLDMALLDTGTIFKVGMSGVNALELEVTSFTNKVGTGKLFGKQIATTDQIPSIPSISISNSGSGNAVTSITASGHTLTVTKGATYLTSSSLSGYATQSWANSQFAPLTNFTLTRNYATIKGNGNEICIGNTSTTSASNQMLVNYRIPSGCTYAPTSWVWRAGSSSSYAAGYWGNLYMNDNLVATQSWASGQFPTKTGTGASGTWGISITGNATTATTASKLGSTTIGGSAKPIYLSSGTPTACSATVGSATVPVYMNAGTITQCSTTLGVSITGNAATATNSTQLGGTAASSYVKANDNISRLTNDSGFITSSALNGYATQAWVNSQNFVKSTSTKKVTDIQPVDALPATQASGVLYLVFG